MTASPRYRIHDSDGHEVGALFDLPWHGQVALHAHDPAIVTALESAGLAVPRRAPLLDAAHDEAPEGGHGGGAGSVHGAYRVRPQINVFFEPPLDSLLAAIRPALERGGWSVVETVPSG